MATLKIEQLNAIANRYDKPFSWPNNTCVHPIGEIIKYVKETEPITDPLFEKTEIEVAKIVKKHFGGSWINLISYYVSQHKYGINVSISDYKMGDIIGFVSDRLKPTCRLIDNHTGFVVNQDTFYYRGHMGMYPFPIKQVNIIGVVRIE